jgi:hypothetical protein
MHISKHFTGGKCGGNSKITHKIEILSEILEWSEKSNKVMKSSTNVSGPTAFMAISTNIRMLI